MRSAAIRALIYKLSIVLVLLPTSGCTFFGNEDLDSDDLPPTQGEGLNFQDLTTSKNNSDANDLAEETPVEAPDTILEDDGFCPDTIYAQYLIKQYGKDYPLSERLKRNRSRRSKARAKKNHEAESLFYARDRLLGDSNPYFGAIPVVANHRVDSWVRYFKGRGRRTFMRWMVRGESMRKSLEPILREQGMPLEFIYLAMVESGFNHKIRSHASATGTWQFMKGTARLYGLKVNYWVDERHDPVKSTIAAASYLRDLYAQMGDWYLAMAAYNAGPGKVRKSIRLSKSRDFWKIAETRHLAIETKNYVPKVLAALLLASNPKQHGFHFVANPDNDLPDTYVYLTRPAQLTEVAAKLGISTKLLQKWNPELIRGITPPRDEAYALRLPNDLAEKFAGIKDSLSELEITDIALYKVRSGDTLSQIARKYKVKIRQILDLNPKLRPRALRIGKTIAIPVPGIVRKAG